MKKFTSTLDDMSYKISYAMIGLSVLIYISSYTAYHSTMDKGIAELLFAILLPCFLPVLIVAMYYLKPESITVDNSAIVIDRKAKPVTISFSQVKSVRKVAKDDMKNSIRTLGNGGLFGYTGRFYNKTMGDMLLYCTQRDNYILIEKTDKKKVIISPDEPDSLVAYVQQLQPSTINA
ncbi:MAG: hypothetical protein JWQ38_656 [Flavipsychrobacter sp.]|nr:hypothetical protein [Flavipsychrobacter sp.]